MSVTIEANKELVKQVARVGTFDDALWTSLLEASGVACANDLKNVTDVAVKKLAHSYMIIMMICTKGTAKVGDLSDTDMEDKHKKYRELYNDLLRKNSGVDTALGLSDGTEEVGSPFMV